MGNYNPSLPIILGQEWVPIRNEVQQFSPAVNAVEVGHSFTTTAARTLQDGRFYIATPAPGFVNGQVMMVGVYPTGLEAATGAIKSVIIPCNSGATTGANISTPGATSVADALLDPGDGKWISATPMGGLQFVSMFFATNQYPNLNGKRILAVNLLYTASGSFNTFAPLNATTPPTNLYLDNNADTRVGFGWLDGDESISATSVRRKRLGEINHFWSASLGPNGTSDRMPWRYADLQRLEATAANRIFVYLILQLPTGTAFQMSYAALEVVYCEEQRVALGGRSYVGTYAIGANAITLRDTAQNINPVLALGNKYTVTLSSADVGDLSAGVINVADTTYPSLNAVREYYGLTSHPGVQIIMPTPAETHLDETFTAKTIHVLPQISLHTAAGPLTEEHVYGRQIQVPVGGGSGFGIDATQSGVLDSAIGSNATFPQVRFYARRFGNTSVPLKLADTATGNSFVSLTPQDLDALPEIVDGWREVTLRFATPPSMGAGGNLGWKWTAGGELVASQWQVLGASAPALSGIAGNLLNQVAAPHQLSTATYGGPVSGSAIALSWLSPTATGTATDTTSDAVLLFSQDPLTITGVGISQLTQTVTGIGLNCATSPCAIPTGIAYNRITWPFPPNSSAANDAFNRTVAAGGWGNADLGGAYTVTGTATDFSVDGTKALITFSNVGTDHFATLSNVGTDFDITVDAKFLNIAAMRLGIVGRYTDANNFYRFYIASDANGTVNDLTISKRVGGSSTFFAGNYDPLNLAAGAGAANTLRFVGYTFAGRVWLKAKVWPTGTPEPAAWNFEVTDTSGLPPAGTGAGMYAIDDSGAPSSRQVSFDNLLITPPRVWFGSIELQRSDPYTDWQTIMLASSPAVTGFNDYEARVGVTSSYRIRNNNLYNFAGAWSTTITGAGTAPGVFGCDVASSVLIFTSNERQNGCANLAYVMSFGQGSEEAFAFPEVDGLALQRMYGRDYQVGFHGTERGGERFSRALLVQNGAVAPPVLDRAFRSLRDLGWADLSYVCVRTEGSDRWFATVVVPGGTIKRDTAGNSLQMVNVDIIESTATPSTPSP